MRFLLFLALIATSVATASAKGVPRMDHIAIMMLENHSDQTVIGNPNAPKITALAHNYAFAAKYYGVTHPSLPNYIAITSGNNWYSNSDDPTQRFDHVNIIDQLEARHISWKAYMESMPSAGYSENYYVSDPDNALYVIRHNPFALYKDVYTNPARMRKIVPLGQLTKDLASGKLPQYMWISPNICNDMHGMPGKACPYSADVLLHKLTDDFVQTWVDRIQHSKGWTRNSVIFVVFDENDYDGNPATGGWLNAEGCCDAPVVPPNAPFFPKGGVYGGGISPLIVIGGTVKRRYESQTPFNHYAILRFIEDSWSLPLLGMASDTINVHSLAEFFSP